MQSPQTAGASLSLIIVLDFEKNVTHVDQTKDLSRPEKEIVMTWMKSAYIKIMLPYLYNFGCCFRWIDLSIFDNVVIFTLDSIALGYFEENRGIYWHAHICTLMVLV